MTTAAMPASVDQSELSSVGEALPSGRASRGAALAVAALAFVLSVARHLPFMSDPFVRGYEARVGACYEGAIQRSYLRAGFAELRGRPVLRLLPTDPPSGPTYANHPPVYYWATYAAVRRFGLTPATLRTLPVLCCALTAALLAWFATRRVGRAAGVAASVVFAAWPMTFLYGRMSAYESPVLLLGVLAAGLTLRARDSRAAALGAGLAIWGATVVDWGGAVIAVGLAAADLVRHRFRASVRVSAALLGAALLGVASYVAVLAVWEGGVGAAFASLRAAAVGVRPALDVAGWKALGAAQVRHVVTLFGAPAALVAAVAVVVALVRALAGRARDLAALVVGFFVASLANVAMAPARAENHEYWWYYFVPAVTLAVAALVQLLWRPRIRLGASFLLVGIIGSATVNTLDLVDLTRVRPPGEIHPAEINRLMDSDDLLAVSASAGCWAFYVEPWLRVPMESAEEYVDLLDRFQRGELTVRRIAFLIVPYLLEVSPELDPTLVARGMQRHEVGLFRLYVSDAAPSGSVTEPGARTPR